VNWFSSFWKALTVRPASDRLLDSVSNFSPRAQQVLALARKESDRFQHNFVGTEHLLLGLIRVGQGTAVTVLGKMGLDLEIVRTEVENQIGTGPDRKTIGNIPYTPRVKKVLSLAAKEARALNHTYVGTEHILLGLLLEGDGVAPRVLKNLGVDTEKTRMEILRELDPNSLRTANDAKASEMPQTADLATPSLDSVDTRRRYDVYCNERNQQVVVYRNALFKSRSKLLISRQTDFGAEFLELEQSNGQTVYLSLLSVFKFCEHGAEIVGEIIPPKSMRAITTNE
jgi:ATP-dependent Clp protease ATP-binding subunit ClpA